MIELTELHLQIPHKVACEMTRKWHLAPRYYDDLVGVGQLHLVELAHRFDASRAHNGLVGFGWYAVKGIRWRMRHYLLVEARYENNNTSIDSDRYLDGRNSKDSKRQGCLKDLLVADRDLRPGKVWEEFMAYLCRRLTPTEARLLRVMADGKTAAEAARELGVTRSAVGFTLVRIRQRIGRLARIMCGAKWRMEGVDGEANPGVGEAGARGDGPGPHPAGPGQGCTG